ncbi:hypothetical protein MATL_G00009040 [Megalops atlanticus]|uniref:EGF-like domain-containing protein n=1 Tax=Megalops atlanticus TaxID=7932 RepID=A0A9D3QFR6_MEGAT|nr:hypothetical protein MATL_G00009040 [Megalops atlanticus]
MVYVPGESSSFSGSGTTIITWRVKQYGSSQQSIKIYFTDSEEMKNSPEWGRGESPRTAPVMYKEASSPSISGAPGAWRKSRLPESSEPAVDSGGYHRRTVRARGLGMGHGMVAAFHSPTSAPTLWLSSSASVLSDKEAAPLPQEAPHNNPDTSGAALPVSHITIAPGQPTEGSGRRADAAGPRRSSLATQPVENGPEPPPFLDASTHSSKHATSVLPPTQASYYGSAHSWVHSDGERHYRGLCFSILNPLYCESPGFSGTIHVCARRDSGGTEEDGLSCIYHHSLSLKRNIQPRCHFCPSYCDHATDQHCPQQNHSSNPHGAAPINNPAQAYLTAKPVRGRVFIVQNQPAILKEETVRLLLQIVLDSGSRGELESPQADSINMDAVQKVEPLLQRASGYEGLQVPWTSGRGVLQSVPVFGAARALSWLGAPGGLLDVTGLREAVREGLYLGGAKVVNITVGGLQADLCSWLFLCPSGFQCVPTGAGNASCTSLCHMDYCKNSGICTHHHGQQPMCQCPVGEDFWFMGRQCDLRMTRQRLVGVCLGVLLSVAVLMAVVSFLAVRRIKAMLIQAKVDQTRSSYRRFNHFDELSGRFWLRSWPGSADSLDNPGFSRSDELLHLRALDRTCCYHDDTLSIASTCPESGAHLNTVYTHGSHYNWDLSASSINEWMADSGKASDLSVCSWPIEPIQWTPFPLLQQLGIHRSVKTPRPHSYCEGMELVDLEKTWTT